MPGVVRHGVVHSAANIDESWIGTDADALFTEATGRDVHVVNDADAAGLAEVRYGAAQGRDGLVIVTTLGTGIGSALVYDGVLVPNSELGHLEIDGHDAEKRAANSVREREELSWEEWAERLTTYYRTLEKLFSPDLFVVGGGVSKKADEFLPLLDIETEIVPATLRNKAGIVGAALYATEGGAWKLDGALGPVDVVQGTAARGGCQVRRVRYRSRRRSVVVPRIAAATALGTSGWKTVGMMKFGLSSSSLTTCAIASAARSSISMVISWARASSRPRKTPGKASTLLIWFG